MHDMKKSKSKLRIVLCQIIVYVIVMSVFENINADGSYENYRIIPVALILIYLLWSMARNKVLETCGFRSTTSLPYGKLLFLLPMAILCTMNLWHGIVIRFEPRATILYIVAMLCIGFVEEILFRGNLLHALQQRSVKLAIIVSSLTFGLGHIVNLINGAELLHTMLQLIYAIAIGLMLSVFIVKTGHILPCCLFHGIFNALAAFSNEAGITIAYQFTVCFVITIVSLGYALYIWKKLSIKSNLGEKIDYRKCTVQGQPTTSLPLHLTVPCTREFL